MKKSDITSFVKRVSILLLVFLLLITPVIADGWNANLAHHETLYADVLTSKDDVDLVTVSDPDGFEVFTNAYFATSGVGNVGIGTSSPQRLLHLSGTGGTTIILDRTDKIADKQKVWAAAVTGVIPTEADLAFGIFDDSFVSNELMRISRSGNVGIGTTVPEALLHVSKSSAGITVVSNFENSDNANVASDSRLQVSSGGASGGDPYLHFLVPGVTDWSIGVDNSDSDKLIIGPSNKPGTIPSLTIDTSGNVGIGTTTPGGKLDILAGANQLLRINHASGSTQPSDFSVAGVSLVMARPSDGSLVNGFYSYDSASGDNNFGIGARSDIVFMAGSSALGFQPERMRIKGNSGNVGIGTTSPIYELHVSGKGDINLDSTDGGDSNVIFSENAIPVWFIYRESADNSLRVWDTTDRFTIKSGGNVGIGTTSPQALLDVNGDILSGGGRLWRFSSTSGGTLPAGMQREYVFSGFPNGARLVLEIIVEGSFNGGSSGVSTKKVAYQFSPWNDQMWSESQQDLYALGNAPADITFDLDAVGSNFEYKVIVQNVHGTDLQNYVSHFTFYSNNAMTPSLVSVTDV